MTVLVCAASLVPLWLLGHLIADATGIRPSDRVHAAVVAIAVGVLFLGTVGTLFVTLGGRVTPLMVYLPLGLLLVRAWRRRLPWPRRPALPVGGVARGLIALTGIVLLAIGTLAARDQIWWDGWAIWAFKARVLLLEGTLPSAFLDPAGAYLFTHPDYPLLVPMLGWWLAWHSGAPVTLAASLAGAAWVAALAALAWGGLAERVDVRIAAAAALAIALVWPIAEYAIGGTADVVIAVALLGAVVELERALGRTEPRALWRCALFLALGAMAKNEGLALAALGAVIGFAALWSTGAPRRITALALLLPFAVVAPWLVFTRLNGIGADNFDPGTGLPIVLERLSAFVTIAPLFLLAVPWIFVAALGLLGVGLALRSRDRALVAAWALVGGYVLVFSGVYLQAPQEIVWLLATSFDRVAGATVPAVVTLGVLSAFRAPRDQARAVLLRPEADRASAEIEPGVRATRAAEVRATDASIRTELTVDGICSGSAPR